MAGMLHILSIMDKYKYIGILLIGIATGFILGSMWIGKEQDEMMRQMVAVLTIATGGIR